MMLKTTNINNGKQWDIENKRFINECRSTILYILNYIHIKRVKNNIKDNNLEKFFKIKFTSINNRKKLVKKNIKKKQILEFNLLKIHQLCIASTFH